MQKGNKMIIGVVVVATLLIGGALILGRGSSDSKNSGVNNQTQSDDASSIRDVSTDSENSDDLMVKDTSRYVEYFDGVLEEHSDKRRFLFFYASWCPTCRPLDADLRAQGDRIPDDVVIVRVNYNDPDTDDAEDALAQKYDVTYQHTFVEIDTEGNEVKKWNGGQLDELLSRLD